MFVDSSIRKLSPGNTRAGAQGGFSLIELLVVILIIGVLVAIAIPLFLGSTGKAVDAQAKELVRSAETATESIATGNDGSYESVNPAALNSLESTIAITSSAGTYLSAAKGTKTSYSLTATATNGDKFTISRDASGEISRQCMSPERKTGCAGGEESSW